jgi:hypothetical protein
MKSKTANNIISLNNAGVNVNNNNIATNIISILMKDLMKGKMYNYK